VHQGDVHATALESGILYIIPDRLWNRMRDRTKVIIGLGSIWGLFAFGAVIVGSFTIGSNDTAPEIVAIILYGFTILPSCILAIWRRRISAVWLIALTFVSAFGFLYQEVHQAADIKLSASIPGYVTAALLAAVPGLIGILLLRTDRDESLQPNLPVQDKIRKG